MREVDYRTYKLLLDETTVSQSNIPPSVQKSDIYKGLLVAEILLKSKAGRGLKIYINKKDEFKRFFKNSFPEEIETSSKSANIRKYRNSKASKVDAFPIFLFRAFKSISVNNEMIDIASFTQKFGLFASSGPLIKCDKICFVENLETFLRAEKLFGRAFLFVHKYGRIGIESLKGFQAKEVIVFVDYDFNGLDEYLRIKSVFYHATLFIPDDFDELFLNYSKSLKGNKAKMSQKVKDSENKQVIKIRELVSRENRFLEQEVLIYD